MKNLIYLILACSFFAVMSCKKEKEVVLKPEIKQITAEEFAVYCAQKTDKNLNILGKTEIRVPLQEYYKIVDSDEKEGVVVPILSVYSFAGLQPILKEVELNVKIWASGPGIPVTNYEDFLNYMGRVDSFRVQEPRPKYLVIIGDQTFYLFYNECACDYTFWRKRDQSLLFRERRSLLESELTKWLSENS